MASQIHESDFYGWTQEQAAKLRRLRDERANIDLDLENIAEELEDMGRNNRQQLMNRLAGLYEHLLKLAFSLAWEPRNQWKNSVNAQRKSIAKLLKKNPSLKSHLEEEALDGYDLALVVFDEEKLIELNMHPLPETPPFDLQDQVLKEGWLPEPRGAV